MESFGVNFSNPNHHSPPSTETTGDQSLAQSLAVALKERDFGKKVCIYQSKNKKVIVEKAYL